MLLNRLQAIKKRGGKVVVVDPRRTKTAKVASQHLFIRPEKDALLLMALIQQVFATDNVNLGHLENMVKGVDELGVLSQFYSPENVAEHVGISAEDIKTLAQDMIQAKSGVCYSRMGASTQSFGGICQWLTIALNVITGNF